MRIEKVGSWLKLHGPLIRKIQWVIILAYAVLTILPALLPLPHSSIHFWQHITLFAQFVFWGLWWPFVLLSIVLFGRLWCGVLCPEGALTEFASRHGLGRAIPRWMRFGGWPFVAFSLTTIYGQMISVYQYPKPVLLILGGSTVGAIIIGFIYGKSNRVWCKYLCPVNGVFALLARLSPFRFKADKQKWQSFPIKVTSVECPTLLPLKTMTGAAGCHMCGKCSDHRDALALTWRSPNEEIVQYGTQNQSFWESILIIYGLCGFALGAFQWSVSHWLPLFKEYLATWLIDQNIMWPFATNTPWWVFTHYPNQGDVFSWLDGGLVVGYILAFGLIIGSLILLLVTLATKITGAFTLKKLNHLSQSLIPLAGAGVFVGLLANTLSILRSEQIILAWATTLKFSLLLLASGWSAYLAWQVIAGYTSTIKRRMLSLFFMLMAYALINVTWVLVLFIWSTKPDML